MRTCEEDAVDEALPLEKLRSVLRQHSVQVALLFGSHARGDAHSRSDVDIAVVFESSSPKDPEYNEVFFGLSADLSEVLATDDVDLVDLQTVSPELATTIFDQGVLLVGDLDDAAEIQQKLTAPMSSEQSPRERFDAALARIDTHLGNSAVPVTDEEPHER